MQGLEADDIHRRWPRNRWKSRQETSELRAPEGEREGYRGWRRLRGTYVLCIVASRRDSRARLVQSDAQENGICVASQNTMVTAQTWFMRVCFGSAVSKSIPLI